jgi:hypothetical protein
LKLSREELGGEGQVAGVSGGGGTKIIASNQITNNPGYYRGARHPELLSTAWQNDFGFGWA